MHVGVSIRERPCTGVQMFMCMFVQGCGLNSGSVSFHWEVRQEHSVGVLGGWNEDALRSCPVNGSGLRVRGFSPPHRLGRPVYFPEPLLHLHILS